MKAMTCFLKLPPLVWLFATASLGTALWGVTSEVARAELRAGAAAVDVTPQSYPVFINGGMTSNSATGATTPIHARAIVLEDGDERIAIVVVDSCMMTRTFLDEAKSLASQRTGIRADRMLI
jgi:neutral ceramidase